MVANFGIPQCFQKWQLPASSSKFPNLATFELPKTCHIWLQNIARVRGVDNFFEVGGGGGGG